jgi:hypothetical protein
VFGLTDQLRAVRQAWQDAAQTTSRLQARAELRSTRATSACCSVRVPHRQRLELILDPDVDSYYVPVDALSSRSPRWPRRFRPGRAIASAFLASGGSGEENSDRRLQLMSSVVRIEDALQQQLDFIRFAP